LNFEKFTKSFKNGPQNFISKHKLEALAFSFVGKIWHLVKQEKGF
jgi:hypothetical protein